MKKNNQVKGIISVLTALAIILTCIMPAFSAFADGGVYDGKDIRMVYSDSNTEVPDTDDSGNTYREVMLEGEKLQLTYKLIDVAIPDGGYVYWYSETPTLVNVDQTGLVRAFDSSKGAAVQTWIDSEVKTIPLIGNSLASLIESALFNDVVDVDTMDTEQIVSLMRTALGDSTYADSLITSLENYLDSINSVIHLQLKDENGSVICEDTLEILVKKNDAWYADFLPNGTHITNKEEIDTTVAVGSTVQLTAITTPLRLHYGVEYSIKSNSVFSSGADIATVDANGLVNFNDVGTVTVVASPDSTDVLEGVKKMLIFIDEMLEANEDMDTEMVADVLVDYLGVNVNKTVLKTLLDLTIAVRKRTGSLEELFNSSNGSLSTVVNYVMQYAYQDTITFTVIEPVPLEDFEIEGLSKVQEGSQIQLSITDIKPSTGNKNDIEWSSSDESIAYVDKNSGIVTGRDSGGSFSTSSQEVTITATSIENKISKSTTIKVTGRTGQKLSDLTINGPDYLDTNEEFDFTYSAYPSRSSSWTQYVSWGLVTGYEENGSAIYSFADEENTVSDNFAEIDSNGHYRSFGNGSSTIVLNVKTGYKLLDGSFYEVSSLTRTKEISNSTPVQSISIAPQKLSNSNKPVINEREINGEHRTFVTVKENTTAILYNKGIKVSADIEPDNASNTNIIWHIDNDSFQIKNENSDEKTIEVRAKYGSESTAAVNIWCETEDGKVISDKITFVLTRNTANSNTIDAEEIEIVRGRTQSVTHTMTFDGSLTVNLYACSRAFWYSDNKKVLKVSDDNNTSGSATISAVDVGTANLYCVSYDSGIVASIPVTVVADKEYLSNVVKLCDRTVIVKTNENKALYSDYMKKLDKANFVLYDYKMASQSTCDTYADKLLDAFDKLGGYVSVGSVEIRSRNNEELTNKFVRYNVGTLSNYTSVSYNLHYRILPENAMYSKVEWTSSSSKISVSSSGVCKPASNSPCSALITCTVYDYLGNKSSDSVYVAFSKTPATGVELNTYEITEGKIGESYKLTATVLPNSTLSSASCTDVIWSSSNSSIASVDESGNVSFLRGGNCKIKVTTCDGGYTAECSVHVITNFDALNSLINEYESLNLEETKYYPDTYQNYVSVMETAKAVAADEDATQDAVDSMYNELKSAYTSLREYIYITNSEIYLDGEQAAAYYQEKVSTLSLYTSSKLSLNIRVYPYNADYESIIWSSSDSKVTVSNDGVCKPSSNKACYSKITCTITDHFGNKYQAEVNVSFAKTPVTSVELDKESIGGDIGDTVKLNHTVKPTPSGLLQTGGADITDVVYSSSNPDVISVDQSGNVTFLASGAATITVTTCDGGFTDTVLARTNVYQDALIEALETYKDIVYTDYEFDYGMAFKNAYEAAQNAVDNYSYEQYQIDELTQNLINAAQALEEHPFIPIESINVDWVGKNTYGQQKESGTVDERDCIAVSFNNGYSNIYTQNSCVITSSVYPQNAMYSDVRIETLSSTQMNVSTSGDTATCKISIRPAGNAKLKITYTDAYGRETSRVITVVMARYVVNGISIDQNDFSAVATDETTQLSATLSSTSGNASDLNYTEIEWSSSDNSIATVDSNGLVRFIDDGTVVITARSFDGGYTDSVTITILADFSKLINAIEEYSAFVSESRGKYIYTEESLDVLEAAINEGRIIAADETNKQAAVNEALNSINAAYEGLEKYIPCSSISLVPDTSDEAVQVIKEGYIRYTSNSLNSKSFKLNAVTSPERSRYEQIEWISSNSAITVSEDGTVTSNSSSAKYSYITCKVTNFDGEEHTASAYVSFVKYGVEAISLEQETAVFGVSGATRTIEPDITYTSLLPGSASNYVSDCLWSSSDESIATVNENGTVTFISPGTATITAVTIDGGYSSSTTVYTTWDTTALYAAIDEAKGIDYMDYAYSYGTAFKEKYEIAVSVSNNYLASQDTIDVACEELVEAMTALQGNEFVYPNPSIRTGSDYVIKENDVLESDDNDQLSINAYIAENAMIKSSSFEYSDASGITVEQNGMSLLITRVEEQGSITLTLNVVDDYNREYSVICNITIIPKVIPATDIAITANGETVGDELRISCSGSYDNFENLQLGYIPVPNKANNIVSVTYSNGSTIPSLSPMKVDSQTGLITLSGASRLISSYNAPIVCTVTNADGKTITKSFTLYVSRK